MNPIKTFSIVFLCPIVINDATAQALPNVQVSFATNTQSEPTISVTTLESTPGKLQLTAWNDISSAPGPCGLTSKPGYAFSTDRGVSWTPSILTSPNGFGVDPSVGFDANGWAYYCYLDGNANFSFDQVVVSRSSDFGSSWEHKLVANVASEDKPFMTIDNTGGNRDGRIYVSWTEFADHTRIKFAYSTNQGDSFSPPYTLAEAEPPPLATRTIPSVDLKEDEEWTGESYVQGSYPAVAPNGDLYVVWVRGTDFLPGASATIEMRKSTDGGQNFGDVVGVRTVAAAVNRIGGTCGYHDIRTDVSTMITANPTNGDVYIAYTARNNTTGKLDGYFVKSTDGGTTWSDPIISTASMSGWQYWQWLAVEPDGKIVSAFRHSENQQTVDTYVSVSTDGGNSFQTPVRVTQEATNTNSLLGRCHYIGNAAVSGFSFLVWDDFRNGNPDIYWSNTNPPPAPPQNVQVAATQPNQYGYRYPKVTWSANSEPDLDGYEIWRKIVSAMDCGNGNWYLLSDTLGPSTQEYIDASIPTAGTGQCTAIYKLRARDEVNNLSGYSNEASIQFGNDMWKANSTGRSVPAEYQLHTAFPNPFNPSTLIQFALPENSFVTLDVFDVLGRRVANLLDGYREADYHSVVWNAAGHASGVYVVRLSASGESGRHAFTKTNKVILAK